MIRTSSAESLSVYTSTGVPSEVFPNGCLLTAVCEFASVLIMMSTKHSTVSRFMSVRLIQISWAIINAPQAWGILPWFTVYPRLQAVRRRQQSKQKHLDELQSSPDRRPRFVPRIHPLCQHRLDSPYSRQSHPQSFAL